jgi:multiple sugar transport system permease protein
MVSTAVTTVRRRREPWRVVVYGLLALGLVVFLYPYLWMVSGTLMTNEAFYRGDSNYLLPNPFSIYVWEYLFVEIRDVFPIARYAMNSVITTFGAVVIYLVTRVLAGYALARKPVPFKGVIVWLLFATFRFPGITLLIPTFFVVYRLGLINTYLGIILVLAAEPLPVSLLYFQNVQLWSTAHERIGVAVVATLPPIIVFILAQRRVMSGFTGGLKT